MKVYVVSICKDSHKTNSKKAWEEGQKEIKRVQSGVLRIFTSKNGAKKYIEDFYNDRATNNATLEQKEKKDGSTYFASLLDSYFESNDKAATYDGISLKDCNTTISIKVNQMIVTEDTDYTDLDDDMYDIFAGEETDRAFEI